MTWGDFCQSEKLSPFERRHIGEVLFALRRQDAYTGAHDRKITYREMLNSVRDTAYSLEMRAGRESNMDLLRHAENLDAVGNLILALLMNLDQIKPILYRHGQRMGAHRS